MTYLLNLKTFYAYYPFQFLLITLSIILFLLSKKLYLFHRILDDYKIYYPKLNIIAISIYILSFIIIIGYLRYIRFGFKLELLPLFEKCITLRYKYPYCLQ